MIKKKGFNHQFKTKTWFSNFWKYPDLQWRALVTFSLFLPTRGFPSLRCGQWRLHYEVDQLGNEKCLLRKSNKKSLQWLDAHSPLKHHFLQIIFCGHFQRLLNIMRLWGKTKHWKIENQVELMVLSQDWNVQHSGRHLPDGGGYIF